MTAIPAITPSSARRAHVHQILKGAEHIFIGYSHSDLRTALRVRSKIIRLRNGKSADSVFLDQDSLLPTGDVSPKMIDEKLRGSDLVIFLCGKDTPTRTEVQREIAIALEMRAIGRCTVLPIILGAGIRLPAGLDYTIHGIFLTTVFPGFHFERIALALLVLAFLGLGGSMYQVQRERSARQMEAIDAELREDAAADRSPFDLARRAYLENIIRRATKVGNDRAVGQATERLLRIPAPDAKTTLLGPSTEREDVVFCGSGNVLVAAGKHKLEFIDTSAGGSTRVVALPAGVTWTWMERDPRRNGVVYELEYRHFARNKDAAEVIGEEKLLRGGAEVRGREREIFAISCNGSGLLSLGRSQVLQWGTDSDLEGEEHGSDWYKIDLDSAEVSRSSAITLPDQTARLRKSLRLPRQSDVKLLATSYDGLTQLYQVKELVVQETPEYQSAAARFGYFWSVYPAVTTAAGKVVVVEPRVFYSPKGDELGSVDGPRPTSLFPRYTPAAINTNPDVAALYDRLTAWSAGRDIQVKIDSAVGSATDLKIAGNGRYLIAVDRDKTVAVFQSENGKAVARLHAKDARKVLPVPNGLAVVIFGSDGSLARWRLDAFGPDGWARREQANKPQ